MSDVKRSTMTMSTKGQIVIPLWVRKQMKLITGSSLWVKIDSRGHIVLIPIKEPK